MTAGQIKHVRKAIGLKQTALAKAAGICQSTLSNIEQGDAEPSPAELQRIEDVLLSEIAKQQGRLSGLLTSFTGLTA
jgi:transcriptional regulator with XRE-family HTH domain